MWQDGVMNDADKAVASDSGQGSARAISDAETLRALADPLRLRILSVLMQRDDGNLPVMSVKELAADLGEPQTKLYRHIKHLESAGLINAVSSRVVSGIVEQRYQACQSDLMLGTTLEEKQKVSADAEAAAAAVLELYRSQFFAAYRSNLASSGANAAERESHRKTTLCMSVARVPAAIAAEIRERMQQVVNDLTEAEAKAEADGADTVTVNVLLGYFSPASRN
jgi:DNA-binding transcriptional ArsR family regulator